jgi:hypothetical protein
MGWFQKSGFKKSWMSRISASGSFDFKAALKT